MVQILPATKTFGSEFGRNLGGGIGQGFSEAMKLSHQKKMMDDENKILKDKGLDLYGITDPKMRQEAFSNYTKLQQQYDFMQKILNEGKKDEIKSDIQDFGQQEQPVEQPEGPTSKKSIETEKEYGKLISQKKIDAMIPVNKNLADSWIKHNEEVMRQRRHDEEKGIKEKQYTQSERRKDSALSDKYDQQLRESYVTAQKQLESVKDIKTALKGNVSPYSTAAILEKFGPKGKELSKIFLTGDEAKIKAALPNLLHGWKEVFGIRLSDADLAILEDKLPEIGKSPESNKVFAKMVEKYANMAKLKYEIGMNIKKDNDYYKPRGYEDMVEERFNEMIKEIPMYNPIKDKTYRVPMYQAPGYLQSIVDQVRGKQKK